jgi:mannose-6-phosphate isomerase-like protein (cupin superfamily)
MEVRHLKRSELPESELVGSQYGGVGVCIIFVDSPPGGGPALHKHPYEEVFMTLEGEVTFTAGDAQIVAGPGDVVIVPPETPHAFKNTGDGPLRQIDVHVSPKFVTDWL